VPILTVRLPEEERRITFEPGRSAREILDETDIRVRAGCNGSGACGLCRIRITGGNAGEPSANEAVSLGAGLLSRGVRLACMVKPEHDLGIEILNPSPHSTWRCLDEASLAVPPPYISPLPYPQGEHPLGVTVDLGTTHISITLLDLADGQRLAGRLGLNPQGSSGADILTRLMSAQSAGEAEKQRLQVIRAIGDGLRDIGNREDVDLRRVAYVVLVGNTAMLALLSGQNHHLLLKPRYWIEHIDCLPTETLSWGAAWGINPTAAIEVIPPLAGFVGSDLLAGIMATRLMEHGPGALLIDFGTNSEMALWDGKTLWVTSAAGGPAFEGCGISCGMPADPGAISRVRNEGGSGGLAYDVIAGTEPRGLCGSGLIDLIACLRRSGVLNSMGQYAPSVPDTGFLVRHGNREIVLTKRDIDIFQRAKASIGTAYQVLLTKAGMGCRDLRRICIGGIFGRYLDIANACEIGLLPTIPLELLETAGNTALSGCEVLLLSSGSRERLQEARSRATMVNLSSCADFETLFLEHLYLQPIDPENP
jgi:uncharacterized 2Fe-2S/4Fe-4S cluster protein (DUF4445 family)